MERKARKKKTEVSRLKPLLKLQLNPNDCFGFMWEPGNVSCNYCHDNDICSVYFAENKQVNKRKYKGLEAVEFKNVPWTKIKDKIIGRKYDEVLEAIMYYSQADEVISKVWLDQKLETQKLIVTDEGVIS